MILSESFEIEVQFNLILDLVLSIVEYQILKNYAIRDEVISINIYDLDFEFEFHFKITSILI